MNNNLENKIEGAQPIVYSSWIARTLPKLVAEQRFLAYTSEVGESFRPLVPKYLVNATYGISICYVGADVWIHAHNMHKNNKPKNEIIVQTADRLIWHSFASMILPAVTIHSIVKYSKKLNWFSGMPMVKCWFPTVFALSCIPFIIHPLDHVTDIAMDHTIRKLY